MYSLRNLLLPLLAMITVINASNVEAEQIYGWNFDWDDNVFFMPTTILIRNKETKEEKELTTAEFAIYRSEIGKKGQFEDYELWSDSFRNFNESTDESRNYFAEDIRKAIATSSPETWQGPSWDQFVEALSCESSAKNTSIITARGHSSESIMIGLMWLQKEGYIKYLPPPGHLFGVSHPSFNGSASSPSATKVQIMEQLLDKIEKEKIEASDATLFLNSSGEDVEALHLWGFSDDDYENFSTAVEVLSKSVENGRWGNIKITVLYTGLNNENFQPHSVVLTNSGQVRKRWEKEYSESFRLSCSPTLK